MENLYREWLDAFESIGHKVIDPDTSARILAVVCVWGNNEFIVYNRRAVEDIRHIQRTYHIQGGETPDKEIVPLIRKYVKELESQKTIPEWAKNLFKERYDIKLLE